MDQILFGNSIKAYCISLSIALGLVVVVFLLHKYIIIRIKALTKKTATTIDDFFIEQVEKTVLPLAYYGALWLGINHLTLSSLTAKIIGAISIIILTIQITRFVSVILIVTLQRTIMRNRYSDEEGIKSKSLYSIIKFVVWSLAVVFLLDNLGFNVSSVIAGLGIGGVAIALAAQTILGDLFNYFVIFFDRPFQEGDFVIVDDYLGTIEHVGIKTTRIRSLGGEQLIFSNSDLTGSRLKNYKRMEKRRVLFKLGVVYQTTSGQLKKIPTIIKEIIENVDETAFDRAHFQGYGNFSLDIEVVYYVLSPDYNKYMDIQEKININIYEAFEKEGIEFAYPTQTLYMPQKT